MEKKKVKPTVLSVWGSIIMQNQKYILKGKKIFPNYIKSRGCFTLLCSERPKLYGVLAFLSAIGLIMTNDEKPDQAPP